jgi:mannose-6-phosphate isomerase-like protein (cupin superfamily)
MLHWLSGLSSDLPEPSRDNRRPPGVTTRRLGTRHATLNLDNDGVNWDKKPSGTRKTGFFRGMKNTLSPLVAYKRSRSLDTSNWYMGSLLTFLAESKDTGGSFTLIEGLLKPGNEPPPHVHGREDELFYILEGEMDMYVGSESSQALNFSRLHRHIDSSCDLP